MKKLLALIISGVVLVGCNNSGSQFVGTWSGDKTSDRCQNVKLVINHDSGGNGFSVQNIRKFDSGDKVLDNLAASLDGDTLIIDAGIAGKIPLKVENNKISWMISGGSSCLLSKQN